MTSSHEQVKMPQNSFSALRATLLAVVWRQWHELGAPATRTAASKVECVIDPEALVLASLAMLPHEPRLADLVAGWSVTNSHLLSIQRLKNLAKDYPENVQNLIPHLAEIVVQASKDLRWRELAAGAAAHEANAFKRAPKPSVAVPIDRPAAFLLRLRMIWGLGIRPDILAFLLRKRDPMDYTDPTEIARVLGYNRTAVKRILDSFAEAAVVGTVEGTYPGYSIGWTHAYQRLKSDIDALPHWRYPHQTFLLALDLIAGESELTSGSAFLRDVHLRRTIERHRHFLQSQAEIIHPRELRGLTDAESFVAIVSEWLGTYQTNLRSGGAR